MRLLFVALTEVPRYGLWVMFALVAGLAVCGWLCIYRTDVLVSRQRRRYEQHWWVRAYPLSVMVMKPWYPFYLRFSGVLIWIWDGVIVYLIWFRKPGR